MWAGVRDRFQQFHGNLLLTSTQVDDGITKHSGVRKCLNRHYFGSESESDNSFLIGSWSKGTRVRPPRDVDLYFVLPVDVYHRFQGYTGNLQSALLQEVKGILLRTYSTTTMRGDGQVVIVRFNTINIEVVPAFLLETGQYWICNTSDGGGYKVTAPQAEAEHIAATHNANNYNLRPMIKMLKTWQDNCSVPIKSFQIELLAAEYLAQSQWRYKNFFYYDWIIRDFLAFLYGKANTNITVPGTYEQIYLGDAWQSRVESAHSRAVKACGHEYNDLVISAGEEWQKIFGNQIPLSP